MTTDPTRQSSSVTRCLVARQDGATTEPGSAALQQLEQLSDLVKKETASPGQTETAPATPGDESDDESLQEYLSRFMERTIGKKADGQNPPSSSPEPVTAVLPPFVPMAPPPREPTRAPECRDQITAMRAVANENARDAVAKHASRSLSGKTGTAFFVAAAISVLSSSLAVTSLILHTPGATGGALITGAVAVVLSGRFYGLCRQATKAEQEDRASLQA